MLRDNLSNKKSITTETNSLERSLSQNSGGKQARVQKELERVNAFSNKTETTITARE